LLQNIPFSFSCSITFAVPPFSILSTQQYYKLWIWYVLQ
jgi:hypothetical protein